MFLLRKPDLGAWALPAALLLLLLLLQGAAHASCGSASCSVNTDWTAANAPAAPGQSFDLRYEAIDQRQPRTGSSKVAVGALPRHHDEVATENRNLVATYTRTLDSGWGFSIALPLVKRDHLHIHNHRGAKLEEQWQFTEPADARVVGRYQSSFTLREGAEPGTAGVTFGMKLPTGRTGVANAGGAVAERGLQPGTGTTDAILGAFLQQPLPGHAASWFVQAQYQRALDSKDGFRPGPQFTLDAGVAKSVGQRLSLLLQANLVVKGRDRGTAAEPDDSGSRSLFLSPGLGYAVTESTRAYAFFQQPIHQHVNGLQLTARRAVLVGVTTRF